MMIDVSLEILNAFVVSSSRLPPRPYKIVYEVRSFWCKYLGINAADSSGKTMAFSIPGLTKDDYEKRVQRGEDVTICIEVHAHSSSADVRVGVAIVPITDAIAHPHLNPMWKSLPVMDILRNSEEGRLYLKMNARMVPPPSDLAHLESKPEGGSYFSTSAKANPASCCPPNLIDHINALMEEENKSEINSKNDILSRKGGCESDSLKDALNWANTPDPKKYCRISHNIMTSPDFPFHIPVVEAAERVLQAKYRKPGDGQPFSKESPPSPPLFTYTPHVDRQWSSCSSGASSPTMTSQRRQKKQLSSAMDDLVSALNNTSVPGKVEIQCKRKEVPSADNIGSVENSREDMPHPPKVPQRSDEKPAGVEEKRRNFRAVQNSGRVALSPKPDKIREVGRKEGKSVPGLTIKEYKAPEAMIKRRIAANIFND